MNTTFKYFALICVACALLGCSSHKAASSNSSEEKRTPVSEQEFVEAARKIEEHHYESSTADYNRKITIREEPSMTETEETYSGVYNFTYSNYQHVDPEDPHYPSTISFAYDINPNSETFDIEPESFLLPSILNFTNNLLNIDYVVNFYKNDNCTYTFYLNPFTLVVDVVYEDFHAVLLSKYNEYGFSTYASVKRESTVHEENKTTYSTDFEEASVSYK